MQLAYFKLHQRYGFHAANPPPPRLADWPGMSPPAPLRPGCCYETAMTRKFYHGRTETMRPCTLEAVKWCAAMTDPSCEVCFSKWRCRGWRGGRGLTRGDFCFRTTRRGKPCSWPLRNTTTWWPRPRKDEVSLSLMGRTAYSEYFLLRRRSRPCRLWQAPSRPVSYRQRGGTSGSRTLLRSALCQEVLRGRRC